MRRTKPGIDGAIRSALAAFAGAAACCCASGCFGAGAGREPARLGSNDPGSKIPAIKKAAEERDPRDTVTAQQLVKSLQSDDPAVRFYAIRGLQNLTGETFGYVWYADESERRAALEKWHRWIEANGTADVATGNSATKGD